MEAQAVKKIVYGSILNPLSDHECQFFPQGALLLSKKKGQDIYSVEALGQRSSVEKLLTAQQVEVEVEEIDLTGSLLLPSFFDMHFHWVQDDVRMMPKDDLLDWLSNYTWPYEAKFSDPTFAETKAKEFFTYLTQTGTLGGAIYSSIHGHALEAAFKHAIGDFIIGNVLMTMNSPADLQQTKEEALELVGKYSALYGKKYAMTPRFAISTDPQVMSQAASIALQHQSFIQTHLSETPGEIDFVLSLYRVFPAFKNVTSYTEIYQQTGILTPVSIMGHGIYLSDEELKVIKDAGASIAHCPTSNAPISEQGLGSGLCDTKKLEDWGIPWALGSDIGGGPYLSMFDVMRSYVQQNALAHGKNSPASYTKALYRATLKGAEILNLSQHKGNFEAGKEANFIAVPFSLPLEGESIPTAEQVLKEVIETHQGQRDTYDQLVSHTFYQGHMIFQRLNG